MAEQALREMGDPSLLLVLDYLQLLAVTSSPKLPVAAVRWLSRFTGEGVVTLEETQLALAALANLCVGDLDAIELLRRLLRRTRPTLVRHR